MQANCKTQMHTVCNRIAIVFEVFCIIVVIYAGLDLLFPFWCNYALWWRVVSILVTGSWQPVYHAAVLFYILIAIAFVVDLMFLF